MYELLGIDPAAKLPHGIPTQVLDTGAKSGGRLKEIV